MKNIEVLEQIIQSVDQTIEVKISRNPEKNTMTASWGIPGSHSWLIRTAADDVSLDVWVKEGMGGFVCRIDVTVPSNLDQLLKDTKKFLKTNKQSFQSYARSSISK